MSVKKAFVKWKKYLSNPPALGKPTLRIPICLYFSVNDRVISSVILQEEEKVKKSIYFVSKVLHRVEVRNQAIKKATLAVVFIAQRLRHNFQSFTVVVMTDLHIRKVLQKPDIAGRIEMDGWVIWIWHTLWVTRNNQGPGICRLCDRALPQRFWTWSEQFSVGPFCWWVFQLTREWGWSHFGRTKWGLNRVSS